MNPQAEKCTRNRNGGGALGRVGRAWGSHPPGSLRTVRLDFPLGSSVYVNIMTQSLGVL